MVWVSLIMETKASNSKTKSSYNEDKTGTLDIVKQPIVKEQTINTEVNLELCQAFMDLQKDESWPILDPGDTIGLKPTYVMQ